MEETAIQPLCKRRDMRNIIQTKRYKCSPSRFFRSSTSYSVGPHGRLVPKTINRPPLLGSGDIDTICTAGFRNRCDRSTSCRLCRLEPMIHHHHQYPKHPPVTTTSFNHNWTPSSLAPLDQRFETSWIKPTQDERMVKRSWTNWRWLNLLFMLLFPFLWLIEVDRGDPRNIDRVELDMYIIAVNAGILSTKYSRNQFDLCPQQLLNYSFYQHRKYPHTSSGSQVYSLW